MLLTNAGMVTLGVFLTFMATWYWRGKTVQREERIRAEDQATKISLARDRERDSASTAIANLQNQITTLQASMEPVKEAFLAILVKGLTHANFPEMDGLLKKVALGTLTVDEEGLLIKGLKDRVDNPGNFTSQVELDAATILPLLMRIIAAEKALGVSPGLAVLKNGKR